MEMISEKSPVPSRWPDLRPLGIVALAAGMVWSTAIAAGTWKSVRAKPEARTIRITGSAKKRIVSDLIQWSCVVEANAPDRTAAYKQLHDEADQAVAYLKSQGIPDAEIEPQSVTFQERWDTQEEIKVLPGTNVPTRTEKRIFKGFETREAIIVRSHDVARVEKASREVTSLLERGVSISSEPPQYFYTKLGALKIEMLAAAAKDARARAENILQSAGGAKIGKLVNADMGIININPANSTDTSGEGNYDKSSLEKDIITIVHATFELN